MKISIKYSKLGATPGIAQYAEKKFGTLSKFLKKFEKESDTLLDIIIEKTTRHHRKGEIFQVKARVEILGRLVLAEDESEDLYATIDAAKDTLKIEIEKFKEKHKRD